MQEMREVKYVCSKCHAEDTVRLFPHEAIPPAINCWKCHAGMNISLSDMIAHSTGMFPVRERGARVGAHA